MVFLIAPQNFQKSIWGRKIGAGLKAALRKRRLHFQEAGSTDAVSRADTVFLFGSDIHWLNAAVSSCNALGLIPFLVQTCDPSQIISGQFHAISLDQDSILKQVICDSDRTVLFGINEMSCKDMSLAASFTRIRGEDTAIYYNRGSLMACVEELTAREPLPETVLCANDFAAVILAKRLKKGTRILSFGALHLAKYYEDSIEKIPFRIEDLSAAAVSFMDYLEKQPQVSSVILKIGGATSGGASIQFPDEVSDDTSFYSDPVLKKMMNIENLLDECDETDLAILRLLLSGETYETIAEACYINRSTLLYRMKKYYSVCSVNKKTELVSYLSEYL